MADRLRILNQGQPRSSASYVLYWAQMNRRTANNHAVAYAAEVANSNHLPLLIYEELTCGPHASNDRLHTFILENIPDMKEGAKAIRAGYFFHLHASRSEPNDIFDRLASRAHSIVTDDYPAFIATQNNARIPIGNGIPCTAVDASCVVPMNRHEKRAYGAYTIRPKIQRELTKYLHPVEMARLKKPWSDSLLPRDIVPLRTAVTREAIPALVAGSDIDHSVRPSVEYQGGSAAAQRRLQLFLDDRLFRYARESGQPSKHATSNLSPYLHFGQISVMEVALTAHAHAEEHKLMADEFLEQLIVRRELAFNFAQFAGGGVESLSVLPDWCKRTMAKHARNRRPFLYSPEQFERAQTHDDLWNAAQTELLLRGTIHGYYRMYWGKKIIEWSPTYEEALRTMIRLHDIYALDGRDPNTYTNILWCFGLHDRPWGERPVFGQLRYMSFDGMKRKTDVAAYIKEIAQLI